MCVHRERDDKPNAAMFGPLPCECIIEPAALLVFKEGITWNTEEHLAAKQCKHEESIEQDLVKHLKYLA